ncbi:UPF0553 protein [Neolecta irregularis DAH-3]|uniref:Queuosine 5'-phosphate N-glycosylase/hydrolase n=1 Tax=Neolecta irregularis (strain DAH-3) TaxID=1198029 RepID=A0A1U7LGH0_NEOID|nr:UPF0553 protein [Neolecta irregularis DAH-3]|eukprot:OLL21693.1 UPF0553 protein [Neolecta irregularis DAH-3]
MTRIKGFWCAIVQLVTRINVGDIYPGNILEMIDSSSYILSTMSEDELVPELREILLQRFGKPKVNSTGVLESAEFISDNMLDIAIDRDGCVAAAKLISSAMRETPFTVETWASHPLNPKSKDESSLNWIFLIDLLNFSFWSDFDSEDTGTHPDRYCILENGTKWTGYWSLCAAINRALLEGNLFTKPSADQQRSQ